MTHAGPDLALLLLASYRRLVDQATVELDRRGYPDVTPTLHYAMTAISLGAETASELAQALAVTKQAAAKTVTSLLERGFIDSTPDPADNRRKRLTVTDLGRRVMDEGATIFDDLREKWIAAAGPDAITALEGTLREYTGSEVIRLDAPGWTAGA
ncbi:MarR family winged helix-turn-helix transcriptional regulator [Herbiconiux sp. UC225_62]|uniref:MarR family winged helix-turn-helix transcriptional regulator n=1 Tax=Herbiconiux sp. UC225_62 TaxID=3350168 RepID=UPI0036D3F6F1